MGGDAAKERRRLKRLRAQQGADGKATEPAGNKPVNPGAETKSTDETSGAPRAKVKGEKGAPEVVRLRLARKMARKASGRFKPQREMAPRPNFARKRKSDDADGNNATKSSRSHSKTFKASTRYEAQKQNDAMQKKTRNQKMDKRPTKMKTKAKVKPKKPKHLRRKMDRLSKVIVEGNNPAASNSIAALEGQMKQLVEQMEEYKRLKQNNYFATQKEPSVVESKDVVRKNIENEKAVDSIQNGSNEHKNNGKGDKHCSGEDSSSSSSDKDEDFKVSEKTRTDRNKTGSSSSASLSSSDYSSSSDEEKNSLPPAARSRGKRRRGRRDKKPEKQNSQDKGPEENVTTTCSKLSHENSDNILNEANETAPSDLGDGGQKTSKKTPRKDDKRRCIGRKPVTDFVIGNVYSGKVKYIKPKLGAFIDIGCHSDAFCHISCTSGEFVSSVTDVLKVDDIVENARVLEINRQKKRITVSLQCKEMAENEKERLKATRQHEECLNSHNGYSSIGNSDVKIDPPKVSHLRFDDTEAKANTNLQNDIPNSDDESYTLKHDVTTPSAVLKRERKLARRAERRAQSKQMENPPTGAGPKSHLHSVGSSMALPGQKCKADLKRERKLARRAERRAAKVMAKGNASQ